MDRIAWIYSFADAGSGYSQRVRKLQSDVLCKGSFRCLEVAVAQLPLSPISIKRLFSSRSLLKGNMRVVLPVMLPATRFKLVRTINTGIGWAIGCLVATLWHPSVVIGESTGCAYLIESCAKARRSCVRWMDFHGALPEESALTHPDLRGIQEVVRDYTRMEESAARGCDILTCQSKAMVAHLEHKHGFNAKHAFVYQCGVDANVFIRDLDRGNTLRKAMGFSEKDRVFVYAGGLASWQMIPETMRIMAELHSRDQRNKLMLLARIDARKMAIMADEVALPSSAYFATFVPHTVVPQYLSAADFGLLLRKDIVVNSVACPTKLGEYLACGLPVIGGRVMRKWSWTSNCMALCVLEDLLNAPQCAAEISSFVEKWLPAKDTISAECRHLAVSALSQAADSIQVSEQVLPLLGRMLAQRSVQG